MTVYQTGLQLVLACDSRNFTQDARVGLTETRYGLLPDIGATFRLPRIIGERRARELILLGEVIDANRALRIGLANRVVPEGLPNCEPGRHERRRPAPVEPNREPTTQRSLHRIAFTQSHWHEMAKQII